MPIAVTQVSHEESPPHRWTALSPDQQSDWLRLLADEYVRLRSETAIPLAAVELEGVTVLDASALRQRIARAMVPPPGNGRLRISRSDFGETISYCVLTDLFQTRFGYKSIRDRECISLPGRGIDAIGVEQGPDGILWLILGETKVSDEQRSPPQVVDQSTDSLRTQHRGHLANLPETARKVYQAARFARDRETQSLLFAAALFLEGQLDHECKLVTCCCLVRSQSRFQAPDYGTFRGQPTDYAPGQVRFIAFVIPDDLEQTVDRWYEAVVAAVGGTP